MQVADITKANQLAAGVIAAGRFVRSFNAGRDGFRASISLSGVEYVFERGADKQWRLTYLNEWGNGEYVTGQGCDATGFVLAQPVAEQLDMILGF